MKPLRVQGAFVDGKTEVTAVCKFVRDAVGTSVNYNEEVIQMIEQEAMLCGEKHTKRSREDIGADTGAEKDDPMLMQAIEVAFECGTVSTSLAPAAAVARLFPRGTHRRHSRTPRDRRQFRCGDEEARAAVDKGTISGDEAQCKR